MEILNRFLSRFALDPDASSFLILLGLLALFGVATAAIWAVWRAAYISLWRWNRRKKQRR